MRSAAALRAGRTRRKASPLMTHLTYAEAGRDLSVSFLVRYFARSRSLAPFGASCLAAGLGRLACLLLR
jgi:hypothetical protein